MKLPERQRWKQLSPLLDDLLERDEAGCRGRLAELRAQDPVLADELRVLLAVSGRAAAAHFLAGDVQSPDSPPSALIGRQIGAYIIESPLGQGGTGSVWRARRADGRFQGAVAVKLLHLSLIGRTGALRFEREGAILAKLTHPHIARLLDAGVTPDGQPYLVLELVEGERIDRHCDAWRLTVEQRLALFDDVLSAVAHAHSHLVIHRDIKPTNILVSAEGNVKLLDFGIARLLQDEAGSATVTAEGHYAMTPDYAAPEQLQGGPITTATDVYALGVLLYQLLAGRHPTAAHTTGSAESMRATLESEPPRLAGTLASGAVGGDDAAWRIAAARDTPLARLRRQLRGDLENIVAHTLRKDPSERYQTVSALGEDLRRHRAHEPLSAQPDSLTRRCAKFLRRNRSMVAAAALVVLAVAGGLAGTLTQAQRAQALATKAQSERDNALRQLAYAKASNEFIAFLLQEGSDKPFTTAELLARAEPVLEKQFATDPAQRAHLLLQLAALYQQSGHIEKARVLLAHARTDARGVPDVSLQAGVDCLFGYLQGVDGAYGPAQQTFDGALARLRADPDADRALLAQCLQSRSEVAGMKGDATAALADAQAALELLSDPAPGERKQRVEIRASLASALGKLGQSAAAAAEFRRAIDELEAMGRGRTEEVSGLYNNLGVLLAKAGQTLAAVQTYERALEIARGLGGAEPPLEGNYATRLIELGRAREAIPLIEHAVAGSRARGNRRTAPSILAQGAWAWCVTGDLARCAELLASAHSELRTLLPAGHSTLAIVEMTRARLAQAQGDLPAARAGLERAVASFDAAADRHALGIRALALLARIELQLGALEAAQAHAARAVTEARAAMAGFAHSEWLGSALVAQGLVQRARGETAAAQASWRAAVVELHASLGSTAPASLEAVRLAAEP